MASRTVSRYYQTECLQVVFHAIVPFHVWEWDGDSHLYVRFGSDVLGDWKEDHGDFQVNRWVNEDTGELKSKISIPLKAFRTHDVGVPFKYVVYSPRAENSKFSFEYLYGTESPLRSTYRCLAVPKQMRISGGIFNQYDTMIYPPSESLLKQFKGIVSRQEVGKIYWPSPEQMRKDCLLNYLAVYEPVLKSECTPDSASTIVSEVLHIYLQLAEHRLYTDSKISMAPPSFETWPVGNFKNVMSNWLGSIVSTLWQLGDAGKSSGERLFSAAMLAIILFKLTQTDKSYALIKVGGIEHFRMEDLLKLLEMLVLNPNIDKKECTEYDFLIAMLCEQREEAGKAVTTLCEIAARKKGLNNPVWLGASVLAHFLSGASEPFSQIDPSKAISEIILQFQNPISKEVRERRYSKEAGTFDDHYQRLLTLIEADVLLLPKLASVCPIDEAPTLLKNTPPYMFITWITEVLVKGGRVSLEWGTTLVGSMNELLEELKHSTAAATNEEFLNFHLASEASIQLLKEIKVKTEAKAADIAVPCMKSALSLVLYTTQQKYDSERDQSHLFVEQNVIADLQQKLSEWFAVVLGSGGVKVKNLKPEIKLWDEILSVDCPPMLQEKWRAMNKAVLESRVTNVNEELRVHLLVYIEKEYSERNKQVPELIVSTVIQVVAEGLEVLCEREPKAAAHSLEKLLCETKPSRQTGWIIGSILMKTNPYNPTLRSLVEWPLWPPILKAYKNSLIAAGMERESAFLCRNSASQLEDITKSLCDGSIKIEDLEIIKENKVQLRTLCTLIPFSFDVDPQQLLQGRGVLRALETRLEEFQFYSELKVHLGEVCNHMQDVNGATQLLTELQKDHGKKEIREICDKVNNELRFHLFRGTVKLQPMLKPFYIMCHKHFSYTFLIIWEEQMRKTKAEMPNLTIEEVPALVWEPTFGQCQQFLEQLQTRQVKLSDVDKYFGHQPKTANLQRDLESFYAAVAKCKNPKFFFTDTSWIPGLVKALQLYWLLCKARDTAEALISLKSNLNITPTPLSLFKSIQSLPQEVDSTLRSKRLCDLTDDLIETGRHLQKIAEHPTRVECLRTLNNNWQLIEWIKHVSPQGLQDLNTFVDIASNTGERSEMDIDKLQDLLTVASGFQSLIYNIKSGEKYAYDDLLRQLETVWKALKQTQNLSKLLEQCNGNRDWYNQVKEESEMSVEAAAYSQMCMIKESGDYKIGSAKDDVHYDIHKMFSVEVREKGSEKRYSLAELQELQSKLLLTTKSDTEKRKHVDAFSDEMQLVQSIGLKLMQLQRAGNTHYFGWSVRFSCKRIKQEVLKNWLRKLSMDLDDWNKQVKQARKKYYHLNNFTNKQLCTIRRFLCMAKCTSASPRSSINPRVLAMLQSLAPEISSDQIWHSTHTALQAISNLKGSGCAVVTSPITTDLQRSQNDTSNKSQHPDTKKQQEVFKDLTTKLGFSEDIAQKAVEHCGANFDDAYKYCRKQLADTTDSKFEDEVSLGGFSCQSDDASLELKYNRKGAQLQKKPDKIPSVSLLKHFSSDQQAIYDRLTTQCHFSDDIAVKAVQKHDDNESDANAYCRQKVLQSQSEEELSLGGFSVQSEESGLRLDYHTTRQHFEKKPAAKWPQSTSGPQSTSESSSTRVEQTVLTPDDADGVIVNEPEEEPYLTLDEVGATLEHLQKNLTERVPRQRPFAMNFDTGSPNLIVTEPGKVFVTVLAMYMAEQSLPLPTFEEVLVCTPSTTLEEVNLLWHRALDDPKFKRLFCLVHAERLSYQVSEEAFHALMELSEQKEGGYRLVIVCSSKKEESPVVSKFHRYRKQFSVLFKDKEIREYLKQHFVKQPSGWTNHVAHVDHERSTVRLVLSNRAGMGKSLFITRMAEKLAKRLFQFTLQQNRQAVDKLVTIPIHGPDISNDDVIDILSKLSVCQGPKILHLDVASQVVHKVDTILFNMLILGGLCDSQGRVWRRNPSDFCAVEITLLKEHGQLNYPTSSMVSLLPSHECKSPVEVHKFSSIKQVSHTGGMDEQNFRSKPYQCVYQYLHKYNARESLDDFSFQNKIHGTPHECLSFLIQFCGIRNPSWRELDIFVNFLHPQLESCEHSVFCNMKDVLSGMKSFVVKFMIRMSRDFATSSLRGEVDMEEDGEEARRIVEELQLYHVVDRKLWEHNVHPYIFFNVDGQTITFANVRVDLIKQGEKLIGCLQDPSNPRTRLEYNIMSGSLFHQLKTHGVNFDEDYKSWKRTDIITKLERFLDLREVRDPDPSYALNIDNFIKILAIQMRFRCGIPVIIMGDTGCGKTRLIKYMCDFIKQQKHLQNMFTIKVHGGTSEQDIIDMVAKVEQQVMENRKHKIDTILFFDEANTTEAIGLIKEVMCDHRIHGRHLPDDIKFIAACNPYRKHTTKMIQKLESAGLGFFIKATETQERIGKTPLRQLVYRVHELPPSMRPLVYDFGQLQHQREADYTHRIVHNYNQKHLNPKLSVDQVSSIARILIFCQQYMRRREDECSFVSLRDIERSMIVFQYFSQNYKLFCDSVLLKAFKADQSLYQKMKTTDVHTHSLVLSLSVCYLPRLQSAQNRKEFIQQVALAFRKPLSLPGGYQQFNREVQWCQEVLLDNMQLDMNTAKNVALRENVFMMAICIELRIPLFLVGKPGSSKSLAKSIVAKSMLGQGSQTKLLKSFKQVRMVSYQCSQLSTSETIVEVFGRAMALQRKQNRSNFVAAVVLDEVGLAEDSPYLPLKALHPLLEDGTQGADGSEQILKREERVAFIGISNWALDPAKMNRGIMVTRTDPDVAELELSARSICSNTPDDPITKTLEPYLKPIAEAYLEICKQQSREFFGLRDFYSTIKMLYWMCKEAECKLTWHQIEHAVRRNFGGLEQFDPLIVFRNKVIMPRETDLSHFPQQLHSKLKPDNSPLELIKANLKDKNTEWNGEDRYLLFITENYAALRILEHFLLGDLCEEKPLVLFGSRFPKDNELTKVCRDISQIKICMETGRTVILLNLENLYESLYDLLNQYYTTYGENRYVDLGLQSHQVRCRVHRDFKLILIAEKLKVYEQFPIPLINRMEKHFVYTENVLTTEQQQIASKLSVWTEKFSKVQVGDHIFKMKAFIGYQTDTPATVVLQAAYLIKASHQALIEGSTEWKDEMMQKCKRLLLYTACPDALIRLQNGALKNDMEELCHIYFSEQHHSSFQDFMRAHASAHNSNNYFQITTYSRLLSRAEVEELGKALGMTTFSCLLQEFDMEQDFQQAISKAFKSGKRLLIVQCNAGRKHNHLISYARHRVPLLQETVTHLKEPSSYVVFVIHIPRHHIDTTVFGLQGGQWLSAHIDDLRESNIAPYMAMGKHISDLLCDPESLKSGKSLSSSLLYQRLHNCIPAAASRLQKSEEQPSTRSVQRITILLDLIPKSPRDARVQGFSEALIKHVHQLVVGHEGTSDSLKEWVLTQALSSKELQNRGTFQHVLSQKIDDVIEPKFAEILAFIDTNHNLDLLSGQHSALSSLWISFFSNFQVCHFSYEELAVKSRQHIPAEEEFKCQFPFSWVVRQSVEEAWSTARNIGDADQIPHYTQLCDILNSTPIGKLLESVQNDEGIDLAGKYISDYIRSAQHLLQYKHDKLIKIMEDILSSKAATFFAKDSTLMHRIAAIHVAYHSCESQILWCVQLIHRFPEITDVLANKCRTSNGGLKLLLIAVEETLKCLQPPWDQGEPGLCEWLGKVYQVQTAVESVLNSQPDEAIVQNKRHQWNSVIVIRMFVENIILRCGRELVKYGRWLEMDFKGGADFAKAESLRKLHYLLQSMDKDLTLTVNIMDPKVLRTVRHCCHLFYMEALSTLCFGQESLQPEIIQLLIESVFKPREAGAGLGTRPLTPYNTKTDDVPTIRSSLLQLLIAHNVDRRFLQSYFEKLQETMYSQGKGHVEEMNKICLFFIMCYEDSKLKINSNLSQLEKVEVATSSLQEGHTILIRNISQQGLTFECIEGLAKVRFALGVVAEVLCTRSRRGHVQITKLFEVARAIVEDGTINQTGAGPAIYLLKLIVRCYGISVMNDLQKQHNWLLPSSLPKSKKEQKGLNPFVVYPNYARLHKLITTSTCLSAAESCHHFEKSIQDLLPQDIVPLIGALYEVITLSRTKSPSLQINPEVLQKFLGVMNQCQLLTRALKIRSVATSLIKNTYSGSLNDLRASPNQPQECQNLVAVIVHTVSVFFTKQSEMFLQPFKKILTGSLNLVNMYLPAMPEDTIPDLLPVLSQKDPHGKFYVCPKGHPYFIGACGRPRVEAVCPYCKSKIGGQDYIPAVGNAQYMRGSQLPVGYILGKPEHRTPQATSERMLSPVSCSLMRVLLHSCLLWASCNSGGDTTHLEHLAKAGASELQEFFWKHLRSDMQALSAAVGRSLEETALLIHLVLKEIAYRDSPKGQHEQMSSCLDSKESRKSWENTFNQVYIQPVLEDKDNRLKQTIKAALTEDTQDHDRLLCLLYERMEVPSGDPFPHFWTYRTPFTLAHLMQTLQNKDPNGKFPILHEFLKEELSLRATQHIPDIVQLQQFLHDRYNYHLYKSEAVNKTFKAIEKELKEPQKSRIRSMFEGLCRAWSLVNDKLLFYARFPLEEQHVVAEITADTPLVHLLPTTTGAGVCTTVLIDYLVQVHNSFVSRCRGIMSQMQERRIVWEPLQIAVGHVHRCHLIDYERHILSVVFSHCHRTLRVGKGEDVKYDLESLEQHLVSRFIAGKPIINLEIPHVLYHTDVYTAERFAAIQKHVRPQVKLEAEQKKFILDKLHSESQNIRQVLDVVNTVLGFLASAGGQSDMPLVKYICDVLKTECPFSQALEHCELKHITSLWKVLSVELATQLTLHGEEPFESFKAEFLAELQSRSEKAQLEKCLELWKARDRLDFLETLYEFIEVHVRHCELHEKEHLLLDHLDAYLERCGGEIHQGHKGFPATVTLARAIATWKFAAKLNYKFVPDKVEVRDQKVQTETVKIRDQQDTRAQEQDKVEIKHHSVQMETVEIKYQHVQTIAQEQAHIRGVEVIAKETFTITQEEVKLNFEGYGFKLCVPENSLPAEVSETQLSVQVSLSGPFQMPSNCELASAVYWVSSPHKFMKPITVRIQHCAALSSGKQCSQLTFVHTKCTQKELPYIFKERVGGVFTPHSSYGSLPLSQFSGIGIVISPPLQRSFRVEPVQPLLPASWQTINSELGQRRQLPQSGQAINSQQQQQQQQLPKSSRQAINSQQKKQQRQQESLQSSRLAFDSDLGQQPKQQSSTESEAACQIQQEEEGGVLQYCAQLYIICKSITDWKVDFVVTKDLDSCSTVVQKEYISYGQPQISFNFSFREDFVTLKIPEKGELNGWKITPFYDPKITRQQVNHFSSGRRIPKCQLLLQWSQKPPPACLQCEIGLIGTRDHSYFLLHVNPDADIPTTGISGTASPSSRTANTTSSQEITLPQLICLKTKSGSINILERIGTHYWKLGVLLLDDTTGEVTQAIIEHQHEDATKINFQIFQKWIQGKGKLPVEWSTLIEVLKDVGLSKLATEMEQTLK